MEGHNSNFVDFRRGVLSGIPVVIGYAPVAMAFGLLSKNVGVSLRDSFLFSFLVFAGASQFMALDLIKAGAATGEIILATFLLNLRHIMMSASLVVRMKERKLKWLPVVAFGVTDETFAIASTRDEKSGTAYLLGLQFASYGSWVTGTVIGYLVGAVLPASVQSSLGIGLYAMFVAILVPEIKKSGRVLMLATLSGAIYMLIDRFKLLPAGWSLIAAIIAASTAGVLILGEEGREVEE